MPRRKRPYVVSLDQVVIRRDGEYADIDYADPAVGGVRLKIGPQVAQMTDVEILAVHNEIIEVRDDFADDYEHVAVEVPVGSPQVEYFERGDQWTPRGDVLRCEVSDGGPDGEATFWIDDREFSLAEFGRMLTTYAGWGMRIVFVPEDRTHEQPQVVVKEPEKR